MVVTKDTIDEKIYPVSGIMTMDDGDDPVFDWTVVGA